MKIIPLLIILIAVALVRGRIMNNACKSSPHAWCAPMSTCTLEQQVSNIGSRFDCSLS
jgi:hypothetical protein